MLVKSPTNMRGYYNLTNDTKRILKDGWLYTGDLGKVDKDGFLYFYGLKKNIFIIYGNKVGTLRLKNVLPEYPLIEKLTIITYIGEHDDIHGSVLFGSSGLRSSKIYKINLLPSVVSHYFS